MDGVLECLNRNAGSVTAVATVALVLITAGYAFSTHKLAVETRKQVAAATGRDALALEEKRRRLFLLLKRLRMVTKDAEVHDAQQARLRDLELWTEQDVEQLEVLRPSWATRLASKTRLGWHGRSERFAESPCGPGSSPASMTVTRYFYERSAGKVFRACAPDIHATAMYA